MLHAARISGLLYATRRGTMFHRETEGRLSRRRRTKKHEEEEEERGGEEKEDGDEEEEEEEVALARRRVTVAYVNHIEARTI